MKPSRLLLRLEDDIKNAQSAFKRDCLRAERAAYLARLGHFEEVDAELAALHKRYDARPNVEISAWLNLVEGLATYFSAVGSPTNDKVKRSLALSSAAGLKPLQALSSAWLAQFDYVRVDMDSMALNLRTSLSVADPNHHAARSRASLVLAQVLHLAGRAELAMPWYQNSRNHAVAEGDDATTSALMHNMSWLRMMTMRQNVLSGRFLSGSEHALVNSESTKQFDTMTGDVSWIELKPILRAQILSLQGDFSSALHLYNNHLINLEFKGTVRLQANLLADKAWCLAMCDQAEPARVCAMSSIDLIGPETHNDDLAAAHSRLAQTYSKLDDNRKKNYHMEMAREAWHRHEQLQAKAMSLFGAIKNIEAS